jgi:hypothetical protein
MQNNNVCAERCRRKKKQDSREHFHRKLGYKKSKKLRIKFGPAGGGRSLQALRARKPQISPLRYAPVEMTNLWCNRPLVID